VVRWLARSEGGSGAIGYQFMWVGILVGGGNGLHASWVLVVCVGIGFFFFLRFFGISRANETSDLW